MGLGIGIIAGVAYDPRRDGNLVGLPVGHLFGTHTTAGGLSKSGVFLRDYVYTFLEMLAPALTRQVVTDSVQGVAADPSAPRPPPDGAGAARFGARSRRTLLRARPRFSGPSFHGPPALRGRRRGERLANPLICLISLPAGACPGPGASPLRPDELAWILLVPSAGFFGCVSTILQIYLKNTGVIVSGPDRAFPAVFPS